jgi:putative transposase
MPEPEPGDHLQRPGVVIFPSEEAAAKLIWLVLRNVQARWKNPPITWQAAKAQMAIQFEDRFTLAD